MDNLNYCYFRDINLNDSFFDALKNDYAEFSDWFSRKAQANETAYLLTTDIGSVDGFMYLKTETGCINDTSPPLPNGIHLKVGTFKFNSQGTRRGERFLKKIFDYAIEFNVDDIYVTVFSKHAPLVKLFEEYGFVINGKKITNNGEELCLVRNMRVLKYNPALDYPLIDTRIAQPHLLAIQPMYHTRLFPDSILNNENSQIIEDVSHTNSIHKIYICSMHQVATFKPGDPIVIYRTNDRYGSARHRSVATSICVFEEYRSVYSFNTKEEFIEYCHSYSIFPIHELNNIYDKKKYVHIIKFSYNVALKKRITRQTLLDTVNLYSDYWGCFSITPQQFLHITQLGQINESLIIN
jgi:hypothetical protein